MVDKTLAAADAVTPTRTSVVFGDDGTDDGKMTVSTLLGLALAADISNLAAGVATFLVTPSSANLRSALTDETGTGAAVFATSPTLVTPALGTIASGNLAAGTGYTLANVVGAGTAAEADADDFAAAAHTHLATGISDSSAAGRALLTAVDVAAQIAALGLAEAAPVANGFIVGKSDGTIFEVQTLAQAQTRLKVDKFTIELEWGEDETVEDGTYMLTLKAPFAFTINSLTHTRNARTAGVLAVQIGGVNVTSLTAIAPAGTVGTTSATAANTVAADDIITLVVSGTSDITGLAVALNCTR